MDIEITTDTGRVTREQVQAIYDSVGFGSIEDYAKRPQFMERLFGPGVYGFFAIDRADGRPVGLLRSFSDEVICAWISEVCVLPSHQRKGIGRKLMQAADARFAGLALYAEPFTHNVAFITSCGLRVRPALVACARGPLNGTAAAPLGPRFAG